MLTFTIDSTPTNQICSFYRGLRHVVRNCFYKLNQIPIFMMKPIFSTTQPTILVSSQTLVSYVLTLLECTSFFKIAPNYPSIQMLNNYYPVMNSTRNNILPTYLGNHGLSYVGNNNIPNPWTIIPNPYYPRNPPLTFPNTSKFAAYPFLSVVSIKIVVTKKSKGVQTTVMAP
jgi:hypothetical protein